MNMLRLLLLLVLLCSCSPRPPNPIKVVRSADMMSTVVQLTLVGTREAQLVSLADKAFDYLRNLASPFNNYDPKSEVSLLNAAAAAHSVRVSPEMAEVLGYASAAYRRTDGYFDITVRPLILLWKEAGTSDKVPTEEQVRQAKDLVGFTNVVLSENTVAFKKPGISVDLGGIAKAYLIAKTVDFLRAQKVENGIVDMGGDVFAWGNRPDGGAWQIGISHPRDKDQFLRVVGLTNRGLLTSGDYERYVMLNGRRYSHIVNPFTGVPDSDIVSVTVITTDVLAADGLSAGLLAMGSKKAVERAKELRASVPGTDYFILWIEGNELKTFSTLP